MIILLLLIQQPFVFIKDRVFDVLSLWIGHLSMFFGYFNILFNCDTKSGAI